MLRVRFSFLVLAVMVLVAGCSGDSNESFRSGSTSSTASTTPSKKPTISQPCSLVSAEQASELLGINDVTIKPDSSKIGEDTLRCSYGNLSSDKEIYATLDVYVFQTHKAYEAIKKANKGEDIESNIDGAFSYEKVSGHEIIRFVGAYDGDIRIGVASTVARTKPDTVLTSDQKTLANINELASVVAQIISKL